MTFDVIEVRDEKTPIGVFEKITTTNLNGFKLFKYKCVWTRFKGSSYWTHGETYGPRLPKILASISGAVVKEISLADKTMIRMQYGPSDQEGKQDDN